MDNSHLILVLAAIVLLAILVLNVNRTILSSNDNTLQAEAITTTNSVAQQVIDLISSKSFDESTVNADITDINDFTSYASFGTITGETVNQYDDVDDYNNYFSVVSTPRLGNVNINVDVRFVNAVQPDVTINARTRMKRVEVKATSVYLPDTLRLFYYTSY